MEGELGIFPSPRLLQREKDQKFSKSQSLYGMKFRILQNSKAYIPKTLNYAKSSEFFDVPEHIKLWGIFSTYSFKFFTYFFIFHTYSFLQPGGKTWNMSINADKCSGKAMAYSKSLMKIKRRCIVPLARCVTAHSIVKSNVHASIFCSRGNRPISLLPRSH